MKKTFFKAGRLFIIAEISANHGQNFKRAIRMIKAARECGADAVKFQTYTPDTLTLNAGSRYFKIKHPQWGGQTLYDLYRKAYTPWEWFKDLKDAADEIGIVFFSTVFDKSSVDFLEKLRVPLHKIASFELVDTPLISYVSATGKPLILSTGMASLQEIREAYNAAKKAGAGDIALLRCVSSYPAVPEEMNLRTMADMSEKFKCPVGLSDHTMDIGVSVCAAALGARIIEKHFTLSRKLKTPDSFFSLEPHELKSLIDNVRIAQESLGRVHYGLSDDEKKSLIFRRSLFAVKSMRKGDIFSLDNVRSIRPADGLKPKYLAAVLGKKAAQHIASGTPLRWDLIA
jgi:pseudaminic acid synthase